MKILDWLMPKKREIRLGLTADENQLLSDILTEKFLNLAESGKDVPKELISISDKLAPVVWTLQTCLRMEKVKSRQMWGTKINIV